MQKAILWLRLLFILGICLVAFWAEVPAWAATRQASTFATATGSHQLLETAPKPTSQSLLVVLLDRSTSLLNTDPKEYSASVAKILTDLWPGKMAIIFFSDIRSPLTQIGPVDLTQSGVRDQLKSQIESRRTQLLGWTPTQKAVEQAEGVLSQANYPAGSRVVMITDGQPALPNDIDGSQQIKAIEQQDAPVFAAYHVPISTFGLGNDIANSAQAQDFLSQVASETGGEHDDVTDPAQLATPVLIKAGSRRARKALLIRDISLSVKLWRPLSNPNRGLLVSRVFH
jgi:hypothetical protein